MEFTVQELKEMRYALYAEWEGSMGIEWTVNGVNIPELIKKINGKVE